MPWLPEPLFDIIDRDIISISLADDADDVLYIDVTVTAAGRTGRAVISGGHTHFVYEESNGKTASTSSVRYSPYRSATYPRRSRASRAARYAAVS